jgi:organic hydroperoxide reductase OsmC/OhrA
MTHRYAARLAWTGNLGSGTSRYDAYGRRYVVSIDGKPDLAGTADPLYRGEADRHNPEDHFLAAIAGCHMLAYLALCARHGVRVTAYVDRIAGTLDTRPDGGGAFQEVTLSPVVTIAADSDEALALTLHDTAHAQCFIANSCAIPIHPEPTVLRERAP